MALVVLQCSSCAPAQPRRHAPRARRLFYFAIPPSVFAPISSVIHAVGLDCSGWSRVVVEKPFGRDSETSAELSAQLAKHFSEDQVYRIDHYLGKEMVQNLMVLRFANAVFEPVWNRHHINTVTITFKEPFGTEGRGGYFDKVGILRDVMQNHLLQVMSLVAMETPVSLDAEAVRDEKVKVLRCVPPLDLANVVLGQYGANAVGTKPGYTHDAGVPDDSVTPTFATAVLSVNNPRWTGVPFILKCGKALNERKAEIRIQFKQPPNTLFGSMSGTSDRWAHNNELVIRIQPNEAVYLKVMCKMPGLTGSPVETELNLSFRSRYPTRSLPDAYTRLLLDVLRGDHSQFVRSDELAAAWNIFTPLLHEVESKRIPPFVYPYGSRGPPASDSLIRSKGYRYEGSYSGAWRALSAPESAKEALMSVHNEFSLPTQRLVQLLHNFREEMHAGLAGMPSTISMIPTFITQLPSGEETGEVWAVDMGGTNLRIIQFRMLGRGRVEQVKVHRHTIHKSLQEGPGVDLFAFVAESILAAEVPPDATLGFTFSFPVQQLSLARGRLMSWTKGFCASGVEGMEVTGLLEQALADVGLGGVNVIALVNDTAGTLMAQRYRDSSCGIGVIIGTGTNAAYVEHIANIPKWTGGGAGPMVINMEWGAFGSGSGGRALLPLTDIDHRVDSTTPNPGKQRFEKMISGQYLGELMRVILEDLRAAGLLFVPEHIRKARAAASKGTLTSGSSAADVAAAVSGPGAAAVDASVRLGDDDVVPLDSPLREPWRLGTDIVSAVEADDTATLEVIQDLLKRHLGLRNSTVEDRRIVKDVGTLVAQRAARLAAVGIAAVAMQMGEGSLARQVSAGIDGSVFEKHPCFKHWIEDALTELGVSCDIQHSPDGSGLGAAIVAAAAAKAAATTEAAVAAAAAASEAPASGK